MNDGASVITHLCPGNGSCLHLWVPEPHRCLSTLRWAPQPWTDLKKHWHFKSVIYLLQWIIHYASISLWYICVDILIFRHLSLSHKSNLRLDLFWYYLIYKFINYFNWILHSCIFADTFNKHVLKTSKNVNLIYIVDITYSFGFKIQDGILLIPCCRDTLLIHLYQFSDPPPL